ncbi:hypothetical protein NMG60_11015648 [Bertholletia excelsa]
MGKKKNKNQGEKNNDQPQQQPQQQKGDSGGDGGEKAGDGEQVLVLKVDFHCEGCATKTKKSIRALEGVESVKVGSGKLRVTGEVDPEKLRVIVEQKAQGKVEFISPLPRKDNSKKEKDGGGKAQKKSGDKAEKKPDDKKSKEKENPVTTAMMKVDLHCDGCVQKIRKTVAKTKGFQDISIDPKKNLVTVKGTMDMKALAETLKEKLKKPVELVPAKKDKDAGEKKEKGGGGEKVEAIAIDEGGAGGAMAEENRMQFVQYGYPGPYAHGYMMGYPNPMGHFPVAQYPMAQYPVGPYQFPAPQMFSDENPNACCVM